jgi:UDP:flavonoid glycosyltransferase YjiC (YdhE family)
VEAWLNKTREPDEFVVLVAFGSLSVLSEHTWSTIVSSLDLVHDMRMLLAVSDEKSRIFVSDLATTINPHRLLVRSWVPQQRVLAHRLVHVFVSHGGLNSIGEAVYAHKPTIILPGFGDQDGNGARMRAWNVSVVLSRHTLTAKAFAQAIQSLVDDDQRRSIVERLKRLHQLSESEGSRARRAAQLIHDGFATGMLT